MTDPSVLPGHHPDEHPDGAPHRHRRRKMSGCIPMLAFLLVCAVLAVIFVPKGIDSIKGMFAGPEDYPGPGSGEVAFTIEGGQSVPSMGDELEELGVVASSDAFVDAASDNENATGIQPGTYLLKKKMKAADVVAILVDPEKSRLDRVTIPEGARVGQIVTAIVKNSDFKARELTRLLDDPEQIGLPAEAEGNPEGYLFPATYDLTPGKSAKDLLTEMVTMTTRVEEELDIEGRAEALGLTPHELITVASILQYEAANDEDYAKVAQVIYNRLDAGMALQLDSTVSYVSQRKGDVWTTSEERNSDSLYNTYRHEGLPPGPIGSPGEATIEAALNPTDGPWLYFVPDFENATTLFTDDYQEHLRNVEKAREYCRANDEC